MEPSSPSPEGRPAAAPVEQGTQQAMPESAPHAPTPEVSSGSVEGANQNPGMTLPPVAPVVPLPPPPPLASAHDDAGHAAAIIGAPATADDVDVIEKEWVNKAKSIVEQTKEDPYQQKKQVSALKADYMKKRYGKEIKTSDTEQ